MCHRRRTASVGSSRRWHHVAISNEDPALAAACEVGHGFPDSSSHSVKLPWRSSLEEMLKSRSYPCLTSHKNSA